MKKVLVFLIAVILLVIPGVHAITGLGTEMKNDRTLKDLPPVYWKNMDGYITTGIDFSGYDEYTFEYFRPNRPLYVVDHYLREKMDLAGSEELIEVIVQFQDDIEESDYSYLSKLGIEVKHVFDSFEVIYCLCTKLQIEKLSNNPRVFYMEYNEKLEYFMDMSLETIKATNTWYSMVEDATGGYSGPIDGAGITCVVVDSGVDAGHPDLDYKEKTILNMKSDTNLVWTEMENTDTSSGHGTHCAGTVAGNGDASGGARKGVAPGANLIGLSTGEGVAILNALGALNWVHENSRPYNNPYNIRLCTNSWGAGGGTYSPNDSISVAINKITYENNVVCVFAAGNSGGDGSTIQSSNYGNTPSAICVAASERDGSGISDFSSRGKFGLNSTYPDIAAPGVSIWSTAARRTLISAMTKGPVIDPYYFAISGTSMATPHVAGLVCLLWQACPSMKISYMRDHYSGDEFTDWWTREDTKMHEVELILKASADYMNATDDNGIPNNYSMGYWGKGYDISQGYGLVNAQKAVALALTLQELRERDFDQDGLPDFPNASVCDARKQYEKTIKLKNINYSTSKLHANWEGEWTRFTNQTNSINNVETDQSHYFYVPKEANRLIVDLTYRAMEASTISAVNLNLVIDANMDGSIDWRQPPGSSMLKGVKHNEIDLTSGDLSSHRGKVWMVNIEGRGIDFTLLDLLQGSAYGEVMAEYEVGFEIHLEEGNGPIFLGYMNNQSSFTPLEPILQGGYYPDGVTMTKGVFDMSVIVPIGEEGGKPAEEKKSSLWMIWILLALIIAVIAVAVYRKKKKGDGRE